MEGHVTLLPPLLLLLLCSLSGVWGFPFGPVLDMDLSLSFSINCSRIYPLINQQNLSTDHPASYCSKGITQPWQALQNYSTLLLEEDNGVLYVGARGALYALDTTNISTPGNLTTECYNHIRFLQRYNETHLYVCGTHAFRPLCAYIDVERFSFSSGFEEGRDRCPYDPAKGYTGLLVDGEMFSASQYEFRSSPDVRRNFPFPTLRTEEAPTRWLLEADFVGSVLLKESVNSLVGDDDKIYFFFTERSQEQMAYPSQTRVARVARARLVCSVPDYELHLNVLRSVFVLEGPDVHSTVFYGIFGLEWKNIKVSAVCQYSFTDIQRAFEGPYMEVQDSKWREYRGKVPVPRPGSCITNIHRSQGINSSRDLPDKVLTFARRHPLMSTQVHPIGGRPLIFKRSVNYVKMAVHRVAALDGHVYTVLFLGTDEGWLHRAVEVGGQMHIIEELQLFEDPQPVDSVVISQAQGSVYVGSNSAVLQVPLSSCQRYTRTVMSGDDVLLQCELHSNLATPHWTLDGHELQGYDLDSGHRVGTDGLLLIGARADQSGDYRCYAVENDMWVPVRLYTVRVHPDLPFPVGPTVMTNTLSTTATTAPPSPSLPPSGPTEQPLPSPPAPLPSGPEFQTYRHMEAMYISLVAVLGGLCLVLTIVLLYVSFCTRGPNQGRKYSQEGLPESGAAAERKRSSHSHLELKTMSIHCNGRQDSKRGHRSLSVSNVDDMGDGFLQIVPGGGSPGKLLPPPAPPLPMPPPLPSAEYASSEYANGMSATLPSVLRKMNGNSYVLLRQTADPEGSTSPLYHSFTEELNRILEKRKHTQMDPQLPDESSV
ncbi:unnamed protein product [Coregonus sp. 'balchen']|nr:unnamed protein product [Coregonus sp. 'balchen']